MSDTKIEWATKVWNPTRGCSRVSEGCRNCYAERQAIRHAGPRGPYEGLVRIGKQGPVWTGEVRLVPEKLEEPMRWRKPERIFVNSMSDLFHEMLTDAEIAAVFGVMAACPRHDFLVLTKRAQRMREWFLWLHDEHPLSAREVVGAEARNRTDGVEEPDGTWPLPNVWLGVSVEDQATADERIPLLLETPAALRFVSYEPALGPVQFDPATLGCVGHLAETFGNPLVNWIIVGGESGPRARPFELDWARSTVRQSRTAGVAVFVKQVGPRPISRSSEGEIIGFGRGRLDGPLSGWWYEMRDRKGGDWQEWPADLRVREFPR